MQTTEATEALAASTPYWVGACVCQAIWGLIFGRRLVGTAALFLGGISTCLGLHYGVIRGAELAWPVVFRTGFTMHLAWGSVATLLNLNLFAQAQQCSSTQRLYLAYGSLVVATLGLATASMVFEDATFSFVGAWALLCIAGKTDRDPERLGVSKATIEQIHGWARRGGRLLLTVASLTLLKSYASPMLLD